MEIITKLILLATLVAGKLCCLGQVNFAPIGATWHYDAQEMQPFDAHGYTKYYVKSDTLIENLKVRELAVENVSSNGQTTTGKLFIHFNDKKVFKYEPDSKSKLFFDFSLEKDDTLKTTIEKGYLCDSVTPVIVDSVGILHVGNEQLNVWHLSYKVHYEIDEENLFNNVSYTVTERLGSRETFLHIPTCSYEGAMTRTDLRCYQDNSISYKSEWWSNSYPENECDDLINITSINQKSESERFSIAPNPTDGILSIFIPKELHQQTVLQVFDSFGRLVQTQHNCTELDLRNRKSGIYFIKLIYNGIDSETFKILKQ